MDQPEKGKGKGGKGGKGKGKRKDGPLARLEMTGGGKLNWDLEDDIDVGDAADDVTVPVEHTGIHFPLLDQALGWSGSGGKGKEASGNFDAEPLGTFKYGLFPGQIWTYT